MSKGGKGKHRSGAEAPNLRRFKEAVVRYTEEVSSSSGNQEDARFESESKKGKRSRKEIRREKRNLVKMRRNAFQQHKQLPTLESLANERAAKDKKEQKRKKLKEKRKRQRERKREKKIEEEEEAEADRQRQEAENAMDNKAIKEMEKNLKLNKRKNKKTLPQAFINDGLDYLLDAVDSEKLKGLYEKDESDDDEKDGVPEGICTSEEDDSDLELDEDSDMTDEEDEDDVDDNDDAEDNSDEEGLDDQETSDILKEIKSLKKNKKRHLNQDSGIGEDGSDNEENPAAKKSKMSPVPLPKAPEKGIIKGDVKKKDKKKGVKFSENLVEVCNLDEESTKREKVRESSAKEKLKVTDSPKKKQKHKDPEEDKEKMDSDDDVDSEDEEDEDDMEDGESESESLMESDEDDLAADGGNDSGSEEDLDAGEDTSDIDQTEPALKEDIYGRLRDATGNVVPGKVGGGYIPPGKRLEMAQSSDEKKKIELERMKKQLKGLINRLSEANIQSISNQIEDMYRTNSRAYLSESLTSIILQSCISPTLLPDRLVMEQGMLLAVLHANVGSEVGAVFLQFLAKKFDEVFQEEKYGQGKEMDNILIMLCHLYNFKIVHSLLIFDILKKLTSLFAERDIELLLVILKNVGFSLRKDDPVMLKDIIAEIQTKASSVDTSKFEDKSRVKFMLEVLMAIRNNNMRKIPNYDPSHLEHLRKLLRGYTKGAVSTDSQLRISLEDLLHAEERGRWWLVGSAWSGRETDSNLDDPSSMDSTLVSNFSSEILELARKQRMNTDIRKNIFCIIMTAEDFVDAFEKLLRLRLKTQQEREIIHVIMELCMQEKVYNPFYSILAQKFCEYHRRFLMTVQFNTWDKLKILHELSDSGISNLASLIAHLIARKTISLSVFKVVEFSELDKSKLQFVRRTLDILLLDHEEYTVVEVFTRIAGLTKLHMLREGLKVFMNHFLIRDKQKTPEVRQLLKERIQLAEKALMSAEAEMRL